VQKGPLSALNSKSFEMLHHFAIGSQTPLMLTTSHVDQHNYVRPEGSVLSVMVHYCMVGMRVEDAKADAVLGARIIAAARMGLCPNDSIDSSPPDATDGSCKQHFLIGIIIVIAACADVILDLLWIQAFQQWFRPDQMPHAMKAVHVGMFLCEATIFACAIHAARHDMFSFNSSGTNANDGLKNLRGADEKNSSAFLSAKGYAVMCTCTTFLAMVTIVLLLAVPDRAWKALEQYGMELVSKMGNRVMIKKPSRVAASAAVGDTNLNLHAKMQELACKQALVETAGAESSH
jgi:hypothetical protein